MLGLGVHPGSSNQDVCCFTLAYLGIFPEWMRGPAVRGFVARWSTGVKGLFLINAVFFEFR